MQHSAYGNTRNLYSPASVNSRAKGSLSFTHSAICTKYQPNNARASIPSAVAYLALFCLKNRKISKRRFIRALNIVKCLQ